MSPERIAEIRQALTDENISWGELAELTSTAGELGITLSDEMLAGDILDAIEEAQDK